MKAIVALAVLMAHLVTLQGDRAQSDPYILLHGDAVVIGETDECLLCGVDWTGGEYYDGTLNGFSFKLPSFKLPKISVPKVSLPKMPSAPKLPTAIKLPKTSLPAVPKIGTPFKLAVKAPSSGIDLSRALKPSGGFDLSKQLGLNKITASVESLAKPFTSILERTGGLATKSLDTLDRLSSAGTGLVESAAGAATSLAESAPGIVENLPTMFSPAAMVPQQQTYPAQQYVEPAYSGYEAGLSAAVPGEYAPIDAAATPKKSNTMLYVALAGAAAFMLLGGSSKTGTKRK